MAFRYSTSICARGLARSLGSSRASTSFACSSLTASADRSRRVSPSLCSFAVRSYASSSSMSKPEVEGRIMDLLKGFDKVKDASKISNGSHFSNDLGLDSLDTVEVVMAIEEEFSIEIPDKDADAIQSVSQAVEYILHQPDAH